MKKIKISKSLVFYNSHKYNSWWKLKDFIDGKEIVDIIGNIEKKYKNWIIVVVWWDWTILKTINGFYKDEKPILGLNFWTKWFLLNKLEDIINCTEFVEVEYPLIKCTILNNWNKISRIAFNEVDIRADTWKVLNLNLFLQKSGEKDLKLNLKWDGFIFSTPAWTTGYNYSLWGPIIPHSLDAFVLTPKAPLFPRNFRSIVLEYDREIKVNNTWRLSDLKIICDWSDFFNTKDEEISVSLKKSKYSVKLFFPQKWNNSLKEKIFLEQWFKLI